MLLPLALQWLHSHLHYSLMNQVTISSVLRFYYEHGVGHSNKELLSGASQCIAFMILLRHNSYLCANAEETSKSCRYGHALTCLTPRRAPPFCSQQQAPHSERRDLDLPSSCSLLQRKLPYSSIYQRRRAQAFRNRPFATYPDRLGAYEVCCRDQGHLSHKHDSHIPLPT